MTDPRVRRLAKVLIHYSVAIKPGQQLYLVSWPLAYDLTLAIYEEAIQAGAHVFLEQPLDEADEIFYRVASEAQLDYVSPVRKLLHETFDAWIRVYAEPNRRILSTIDPQRIARKSKADSFLNKLTLDRAAKGEMRWCLTVYPNNAYAQDANMSLHDYTEFVFAAGMLNQEDPVAFWKDLSRKQAKMIDWLKGKDLVVMKGSNIDLSLSIKDRLFVNSDGRVNFPDGEIFTGPVEDSAKGWIRFKYPAIYFGQEVTDIELWFENGRVVKEKATNNQKLLTSCLNTDQGSRYLGELGIGTNYGITKFTKEMLFDEKIGGTIHMAAGAGFPETGSRNVSGIHWDMLCDMAESEVTADGELFYKDGKTVVE